MNVVQKNIFRKPRDFISTTNNILLLSNELCFQTMSLMNMRYFAVSLGFKKQLAKIIFF